MPAIDNCQPQVINGVRKEGWRIDKAPLFARLDSFIDILALRSKTNNGSLEQIIVVEVKCFDDRVGFLDDLYRSIGQYLVYRKILRTRTSEVPIYLALPNTAYHTISQMRVILDVIHEIDMKLLVVNLDTEEIETWIG